MMGKLLDTWVSDLIQLILFTKEENKARKQIQTNSTIKIIKVDWTLVAVHFNNIISHIHIVFSVCKEVKGK